MSNKAVVIQQNVADTSRAAVRRPLKEVRIVEDVKEPK
jgi:hypothetical protein